ncbi:MAG: hypothetical protein RIS29_2714 [Bacteroidota bacterium]
MATSQNPLTGKMSGAVGNFVTSTLGSKNIVRSKAFARRDPKTDAQQKQRDGFKLVADLSTTLGGIPQEGFVQLAGNVSAYTAFVAKNIREALDKTGDVTVIDYSKVSVSDGTLPLVAVTGATVTATGVELEYAAQSAMQANRSDDEIIAVVLLKTGEVWVSRQARGEAEEAKLVVAVKSLQAENVQAIYVFALRADKSKASGTTWVAL